MVGRLSMLVGLIGAGLAHVLPRTPQWWEWALALVGLAIITILAFRNGFNVSNHSRYTVCQKRYVEDDKRCIILLRRGLIISWALVAGLAWTSIHTDWRLADTLDEADEDKVSRVVLRIDTLVRMQPGSRRFEAEVLESMPAGIPRRIAVSWHTADYAGPFRRRPERDGDFPDLIPGQVWRMSLNLRRPYGASNPHGFDYEGHLFAQGVRAIGSVRGTPRLLDDKPWASLSVAAERARHRVRQAMAPYVDDKRYGAVLRALAIGDQAGVDQNDWIVFNRTSITHLISISGSHITMIAALGGLLTFWGWKRLSWRGRALTELMPAQVSSCLVALLVAWLYCLLAGWGVPARRTFLMLAVLAGAHILRLPLGAWRVLLLAAVAVVLLDPWALLASGFWLSFGAVAVLLASGTWTGTIVGARTRSERIKHWLLIACRLQLAVTVGLMPVLAMLFNEISVVSPLANAYAIPVVSLIVTPLSLILAGAAMVPGLEVVGFVVAGLAHGALQAMMVPTQWLARLPLAQIDAASAPFWVLLLAVMGMGVAVVPRGLPQRFAAWLLLLPVLFWRPDKPGPGDWHMLALDVGQGSALLVQTAQHALLFDTGIRHSPDSDVGARTILPLLRAKGLNHLDLLVVSHADLDHVGGTRSILDATEVTQSYSSFDLAAYLRREAGLLQEADQPIKLPQVLSRCVHGVGWSMDDVRFEFLWPLPLAEQDVVRDDSKHRNAQSCVLHIRGRHHTAVLTGDISDAQERELIRMGLGTVDVVVAGHHGSRTSSGKAFVAHTAARHVVAQAGRWNRYGHPHPTIERRWTRTGAHFWRTDLDGAISVQSTESGLDVRAWRQTRARHWSKF